MSTVKIILRTSKINSLGEAPLCIRITKDRISKFVFLNYRIKPVFWDDENKRVKKSHPNSTRLNHFLATKMKEAQDSSLQLEVSDKNIMAEKIKEQIMGKAPESFFKYADRYIQELEANNKFGSHRKTITAVNNVRSYTQGRDLFFEQITVTWLKEYSNYLMMERNNVLNSVASNFRTLRRIINLAISEDLIGMDKNPFMKFRIKTEKVKKNYLTDEELMMIELAPLEKDSRQDLHRNMFVFAAYAAGLRISDVLFLRWKDFDGERVLVDTRKTGSTVSIKLPSKALEILAIYQKPVTNPDEFIFPVLNNETDYYSDPKKQFTSIANADHEANYDLKAISKIVGIEKKVTFHTSRHSWAVRALKKGVRIEYVSKLMGHATISTTQIYAQVINEELDKAMSVFN